MHVWTQAEFLRADPRTAASASSEAFDIEAAARQAIEFIVVLRKQGPLPAPAAGAGAGARRAAAAPGASWRGRGRATARR